jgi:hypothetical protein
LQHHRGLIGKGVERDEVAPPDLDAIDVEIARCDIDQPLQHEGGFRTAGAAIGIGRHGVRKDHLHLAIDRRGGIDAGEQRAIKVGRNVGTECRDIGADICQGRHAQPEKFAVPVERQFAMGDMVAALRVGLEGLAAIGDPFHRPLQFARCPGHQSFLSIDDLLAAETAADIRRHHAQLALGNTQHQHPNQHPRDMGKLGRGIERVVAGRGLVLRQGSP